VLREVEGEDQKEDHQLPEEDPAEAHQPLEGLVEVGERQLLAAAWGVEDQWESYV
jgi:hypothetical protein